MRIIQFIGQQGVREVGLVDEDRIQIIDGATLVYTLFSDALNAQTTLEELIRQRLSDRWENYQTLIDQNRLLVPFDHPDPYHNWITGTGLTHLGSATSRNAMHTTTREEQTDSMKLFQLGVEQGQMKANEPGCQPEWFYKGNGLIAVHPGQAIPSPSFALDGGEEPELVGLYLIDGSGHPHRVGFALGNEFSDHKLERQNYLYLAHSKLRACSYGPELLLGELPAHIVGTSRLVRDGRTIWEKEFLTGEQNMSHNFANLEYHHFKYDLFRQPGDVHVHFFGTSVLSFSDGVETKSGDVFEIAVAEFGKPLHNALAIG